MPEQYTAEEASKELSTRQAQYHFAQNEKPKPDKDTKDLPFAPSPSIQPREGGRNPRF